MKLIKFSYDKNGKKLAHFWGVNRRWFRMSLEVAELEVVTGAASEVQQ